MRNPSKSEYDMDIERYELSHEISSDSSAYARDQFQRQTVCFSSDTRVVGLVLTMRSAKPTKYRYFGFSRRLR